MVSYSRVLAEGLGIPCGIGMGDRVARVTVLMLLLEELLIGLATLAILSIMTALLRVYHVYVQRRDDGYVRVATCSASGRLTALPLEDVTSSGADGPVHRGFI